MLRENVIHGLPAEDEWRYQLVQGSSFFRSKVYALTAVVFELLIRRIGIFCPIEILVMSASVVGTAIADIRRLFELPKVPDDAYVKVETTKILKQHKAYMAQFEEMLNDKEIA